MADEEKKKDMLELLAEGWLEDPSRGSSETGLLHEKIRSRVASARERALKAKAKRRKNLFTGNSALPDDMTDARDNLSKSMSFDPGEGDNASDGQPVSDDGTDEPGPDNVDNVSPGRISAAGSQNPIFTLYFSKDPAAVYFETDRGDAFDGCFSEPTSGNVSGSQKSEDDTLQELLSLIGEKSFASYDDGNEPESSEAVPEGEVTEGPGPTEKIETDGELDLGEDINEDEELDLGEDINENEEFDFAEELDEYEELVFPLDTEITEELFVPGGPAEAREENDLSEETEPNEELEPPEAIGEDEKSGFYEDGGITEDAAPEEDEGPVLTESSETDKAGVDEAPEDPAPHTNTTRPVFRFPKVDDSFEYVDSEFDGSFDSGFVRNRAPEGRYEDEFEEPEEPEETEEVEAVEEPEEPEEIEAFEPEESEEIGEPEETEESEEPEEPEELEKLEEPETPEGSEKPEEPEEPGNVRESTPHKEQLGAFGGNETFGGIVTTAGGRRRSVSKKDTVKIAEALRCYDGNAFLPGSGREEGKRKTAEFRKTMKDFGFEPEITGVSVTNLVTFISVTGDSVKKMLRDEELTKTVLSKLGEGAGVKASRLYANSVTFVLPGSEPKKLYAYDLVRSEAFLDSRDSIPVPIGLDPSGKTVVAGLDAMKSLLIGGQPGTGKTSLINNILAGILCGTSPRDVKLVFARLDGDVPEGFDRIPHLAAPVIKSSGKCVAVLERMAEEVGWRLEHLKKYGCRNVYEYNAGKGNTGAVRRPGRLPEIVFIVDEYSSLMSSGNTEKLLTKIISQGDAAGVRTVLSTQEMSANVITGIIKANFETRVAFKVSSHYNSRMIIDETGAESLLTPGDILLYKLSMFTPVRMSCAFASDEDVANAAKLSAGMFGEHEFMKTFAAAEPQ